jgi:hypothetical protein
VNETELREWLGLGTRYKAVELPQDLLNGMADVKVPVTDDEHVEAFKVYLACMKVPVNEVLVTRNVAGNSGPGPFRCRKRG